MRSLRIVLSTASLLILLACASVAQTPISIGASTGGTVEFSGTGQTPMALIGSCTQAICIQGNVPPGAGEYDMSTAGNNSNVSAGLNPNIFAVNMDGNTMNFNFIVGSSAITGTVQRSSLANSSALRFIGTDTVAGSSGMFAALWRAGSTMPLDVDVSLPPGKALASPVTSSQASSTFGGISSAEIIAAPEPASIALIGSGLLALGGMLKRRTRK
jgi:hypothetical protein